MASAVSAPEHAGPGGGALRPKRRVAVPPTAVTGGWPLLPTSNLTPGGCRAWKAVSGPGAMRHGSG